MSITIQGQSISQSRLDKIMTAETLDEAQRLSLFESLARLFGFGVDREVVKEAFMSLRKPLLDKHVDTGDLSAHQAILENYHTVYGALPPHEGKRLCRLDVVVNEKARTWSYSVNIGGMNLVNCKDLPIGNGSALACFQDYGLLKKVTDVLSQGSYPNPSDIGKKIWESFKEIEKSRSYSPEDGAGRLIKKTQAIAQAISADNPAGATVLLEPSTYPDKYPRLGFNLTLNHRLIESVFPRTHRQLLSASTESLRLAAEQASQSWEKNKKSPWSIVREMADSEKGQPKIHAVLGDPLYCSNNFVSLVENADSQTFTAVFTQKKNGQEESEPVSGTLVFSNRPSRGDELCGERLRYWLRNSSYRCISDLIEKQQGSASNDVIIEEAKAVKNKFDALETMLRSHWDQFEADIEEDCAQSISCLAGGLEHAKIGRTSYRAVSEARQWEPQVPANMFSNELNILHDALHGRGNPHAGRGSLVDFTPDTPDTPDTPEQLV